MVHKRRHLLACILFSFSILVACGPSPEQQATMTATALTATAAAWTPTPTVTNTPTSTPTPTPTSTLTPTPTPSPTPTKTPTPSFKTYLASDGSFSLNYPGDWALCDLDLEFDRLCGPFVGEHPIIILNFEPEENDLDLQTFYISNVFFLLRDYPNLIPISSDPLAGLNTPGLVGGDSLTVLTTPSGLNYYRFIGILDKDIRITLYFFENGNTKLTIGYSRGDQKGEEYDALVDEAINTLQFNP
jgi:hypothetical protein